MRPDLIIELGGRPLLVADCKYKQTESEAYKTHDVYQVLAYCVAIGVQPRLVDLPIGRRSINDMMRIVNSDIVTEQKTIDLGLPFRKFKQECERFTGNLFARAQLIDRFSEPSINLLS